MSKREFILVVATINILTRSNKDPKPTLRKHYLKEKVGYRNSEVGSWVRTWADNMSAFVYNVVMVILFTGEYYWEFLLFEGDDALLGDGIGE